MEKRKHHIYREIWGMLHMSQHDFTCKKGAILRMDSPGLISYSFQTTKDSIRFLWVVDSSSALASREWKVCAVHIDTLWSHQNTPNLQKSPKSALVLLVKAKITSPNTTDTLVNREGWFSQSESFRVLSRSLPTLSVFCSYAAHWDYFPGWWFQPLWKMFVNWDDDIPKWMEK